MKPREGNWSPVPCVAMWGASMARQLVPLGLGQSGLVAVREAMIVVMILGWFGLANPAQISAGAAPAEPVIVSSPASHTFDLTYQETDEVLVSGSVAVRLQSAPFQKEPALPGQNVFRGSLLWKTQPRQATAFIWDKGRGRLFLDLNRNLDFTGDPKGIFASASRDDRQTFTNIQMLLPMGAGDRPVRLQLEFSEHRWTTVTAYAGLCSYWQAPVSLNGKEWQFGLVESVLDQQAPVSPRYVLLRPWADRLRRFHLNSSTPEGFAYTKRLFFGQRAYELECRYEPRGEAPRYKVTFTEQAPRLGELKVTGADLHRIILTTQPAMTVVLDRPQGAVQLPVGSYSLSEIWLRKGDTEVCSFRAGRLDIEDQHPASLVAGGPLTNSVGVRSQRDILQLSYRLLGADGRAYQFPRPDRDHPPEFAVFQGTNRLAADKFRFG